MLSQQQIDEARKKIGITSAGNTGEANIARRRQLAAKYDAQQQKPDGFLQDTAQDIKQTFGDLGNTVAQTKGKIQDIANAEVAGEQGGLRSFGQAFGTVAGGISRGLGDIVKGVVKTVLPQSAEDVVKTGIEKTLSKVIPVVSEIDRMAGSPVGTFIENYKYLDAKSKRDVSALLGISQFALDLATMGVGKKTGEVAVKTGGELATRGTEMAGQAVSKVGELATRGTEMAGQAVSKVGELATKVGEVAKPTIGTAFDLTKGAGRTIGNLPTKMKTNIAEKQVAIKAIESLPTPVAKKSASLGIDVADVNTILNIPKDIKGSVKNLYKAVKDYSTGVSKVRPEEVVGKPITSALKNLDSMRTKVGQQLGEVAKNLGTVSQKELFVPVFNKLKNVINGLTVKNGKLNFSNTVLTTAETASDRKAIQSIFEQAIRWGSGAKKHKLRQELFEILGGKKKSLTNITATQEKAYEAIRQGLSDVLDTKNTAYKTLNTEYAKIVEPLRDLRKMMKGIVGADEDILDMSAGLLARRLTSNAPSNPQLRSILKKIDSILKEKGNTLTNLEGLQDVYNVLDKYYDIAAKTGFQGQIKSAMIPKAGDLTSRAFDALTGFAGETPAVRQKALEDLLSDVLK